MKPSFFLPFLALPMVMAGCGGSKNDAATPGGSTTTAPAPGGDASTITILSPHNNEIKSEFKMAFEAKNPGLTVSWQDQSGGTGDILSYIRSQFKARGKQKGIGADLFFGGGGETFAEIEKDGLLQSLPSDYSVPAQLNGVPLRGANNTWVAAALSGFGILYNKNIAARDKLPIPQTWADLGNPALRERVELVDPRHSGSAHTAYEIILQTNGWDKGWKTLTVMAGNAHKFLRSSSDPLQDVQNGEAVFCPAIDFYARGAIADAGADKLGYIEPKGQYVVTADPIGLFMGAPNAEAAKKFVAFVMSPAGQKLWFLPQGSAGGPKESDLRRIPAIPSAFKPLPKDALIKSDPYAVKNSARYDAAKAASRRRALDDLIGTVLVDNHDLIKAAWKKNPDPATFGFVPIPEADFAKIAAKWSDAATVSAAKAAWGEAARKKFSG